MLELFAAISLVLTLLAAPPYIIDTFNRKTKPQRATWLILSILGLIGFFSQLAIEANWSLVFLGVDTAASLTVLGLSIPFGIGGFSLLDRYALVVAAIGVIVSVVANRPVIALLGIILADVAGTFLTVRKAFLHPGTETTISWVLVGSAAVFSVLAVGKTSLDLLIWPVYLVLANFAVPAAQFAGRSFIKAKT